MKIVLFCRVSSKEQEETGYSLPAQEKLLKSYADTKEFKINKIFSISESASGQKQRQIFESMMSYIKKQGIKIIICEKVDRLTRNFKDAVDINDWMNGDSERQVHFIKENVVLTKDSKSNEKFIWNIKVSVAQYYIDNLSEEVKKGQKEKIAQGWLPTKPPLGYKTIGEKGHKTHILNEEKAILVKRMFELYSTGNLSLKKLTEQMFKDGLRSNYDNKVVKSRIHDLLTDPFYYGKIRWNGDIYEGQHEPLISKETYEKVQNILKSKTTPKYNKHQFLFRGCIKCKECGGIITWEIQKGIIYGHCNHYRNCSQQIWVKEPEIESQLLEGLDNLQIKSPRLIEWIRKALKESHKEEIDYHGSAIKELNQRQEQIKQRLNKLYDDKLDEKINEDFYQQKFRQYSEELEIISDSAKKHNQTNSKYLELGINIYDLSQKAKEVYLKAKTEDKRQLIKLIFNNLIINEGKLEYSYTTAFKILSEAVKATNSSKIPILKENKGKIFEPGEKTDKSGQYAYLQSYCPTLLRR
jgi:site-specific DNA recombinase